LIVKYRKYLNDIVVPKKIKIKVPGWAGNPGYDEPSPWHCKPFIDACCYSYELSYPFDGELFVKKQNGKIIFESENKLALKYIEEFAPNYYSISSFIDLIPPEGFLTRLEPHPRFYTDHTGTCPIAVSGHIKRFWSRVFFVVFKAPLEGQVNIFSHNQPYASLLFIPENPSFELSKMNSEEIKSRENLEATIHEKSDKIATHKWTDAKGNNFNNKYKVLNKIYEKSGIDAVFGFLNKFKPLKIKKCLIKFKK